MAVVMGRMMRLSKSLPIGLVPRLSSTPFTVRLTLLTYKSSPIGSAPLNVTTLTLEDAEAVKTAFEEIESSVSEKVGEGFDGVAVQPMIKSDGYELIVGSALDPQFGPVLLFGSGGSLVEVYKDRALALPPLNLGILAGHTPEGCEVVIVDEADRRNVRLVPRLGSHDDRHLMGRNAQNGRYSSFFIPPAWGP